MANFYYDPGVQDRRGELLGAGISQGMASLADSIQQAEQKHKENKAYAQLADVLGLDPKHSTKLDVQAAMLRNEIMAQRQALQTKQQAQGALGKFFQSRASLMQPKAQVTMPPMGNTYSTAMGSPDDMMTRIPGMSDDAATLQAFAQNPQIFGDPDTSRVALNMAKLLGSMGTPKVVTDPATGLRILQKGNTVRAVPPNYFKTQPDPNAFSTVNVPGGGSVFMVGNHQINPRDIVGGPVPAQKPGKYPKGAKVQTLPDGKVQVVMPDGSFDIIGNPPNEEGDEFKQILNDASGTDAGASKAGAATDTEEDETNTPAQTFEKGERVKQNGQTYEFDGTNWNPVNE